MELPIEDLAKHAKAARAAWVIVSATAVIYPAQLIFAVLTLLGLAGLISAGGWVGYADLLGVFQTSAESMFVIGLLGSLVISILSVLAAALLFLVNGVSSFHGLSPVILALCFAAYLIPVVNFLPCVWLWCLYVVISQGKK